MNAWNCSLSVGSSIENLISGSTSLGLWRTTPSVGPLAQDLKLSIFSSGPLALEHERFGCLLCIHRLGVRFTSFAWERWLCAFALGIFAWTVRFGSSAEERWLWILAWELARSSIGLELQLWSFSALALGLHLRTFTLGALAIHLLLEIFSCISSALDP